MIILTLDLSKRSTGWAVWESGKPRPYSGRWVLGSEYTSQGKTFAKLQREMMDLRKVHEFTRVYLEAPILPGQLGGHTNNSSLRVLSGLAAHVHSYCSVVAGVSDPVEINVSSWRKDFIGSQKRGTKRHTLKSLTLERCAQLDLKPRTDDEADALGLLDYVIEAHHSILPPWRENEVLRPPLGMA